MIDGWVDGQIGDNLFFEGVDAWVAQENICDLGASGVSGALSLEAVSLETNIATNTTTFVARGQSIQSISLDVFGLDGEKLFGGWSAGTHLSWNQADSSGAPLANGTYLYRLTASDFEGNTLSSDIGKLVVLH